MAEVLDSYDFGASAGRYPWDEWLDGQIRKLEHGTDFDVKPTSFLTTAKKQANKAGKTLKSRTDGNDVVIQAT